MSAFIALVCYFSLLCAISVFSSRRQLSASDFIMGSRSLNYWLTALAAHASDMSSWLFTAYPAMILLHGLCGGWTALGLLFFMFLNWQWIAGKIRLMTGRYNSLTLSAFFESRFQDTTGRIRLFTALMSLFFYTIYVSAGLLVLGLLLHTLFGLPYLAGIGIGVLFILPYLLKGGYITLAWIDLFQGLFLMAVIIAVPLSLLSKVGGWGGIREAAAFQELSLSLFPDFSVQTVVQIAGWALGWGLGYFGQPHILTKFMGIRDAAEIPKSKYIGMSWMLLSLGAATLVGLVGLAYFRSGLSNPEEVFIGMVKESFPGFLGSFILCSVVATTLNAISGQVLVLSSSLTEDFYRTFFRKEASSKELLRVTRAGILAILLIASGIAAFKPTSINTLVFYAWSGLGSSFGPLMILSLYSTRINKYGAWGGILGGGAISAFWPWVNAHLSFAIPAMIPGFLFGLASIVVLSKITAKQGALIRE